MNLEESKGWYFEGFEGGKERRKYDDIISKIPSKQIF